MYVDKQEKTWTVYIEEKDNQLGLINIIRYLDSLNQEINDESVKELQFELDLSKLESANSELIAQFVIMQTTLVRHDGRLRIINVNPELKSTFDVVMLDKIISIQYIGIGEDQDDDSEE